MGGTLLYSEVKRSKLLH